jgi:hypothetical protein
VTDPRGPLRPGDRPGTTAPRGPLHPDDRPRATAPPGPLRPDDPPGAGHGRRSPIAALVEALASVWVSADGRGARIGDLEIDSPSARRMAERLGQELYQRLHAGHAEGGLGERDPALEASLAEATPHLYSPLTAEKVADGVALIDGVRVRLPPDMLAGPDLLLPAARPALSPGHYLVDGPTGRIKGGPILRVYVHLLSPSDAADRWHDVLAALNDAGVTYRAKVVSTPGGYPRRDALVVYLGPGHWEAAAVVRDAASGRPGVGRECSLFAHPLAPGIAIAWNPADPRAAYRGMSFGEHRARVAAEALLRNADRGTGVELGAGVDGKAGLAGALAECFRAAAVDAVAPARNRDSPALPALGL